MSSYAMRILNEFALLRLVFVVAGWLVVWMVGCLTTQQSTRISGRDLLWQLYVLLLWDRRRSSLPSDLVTVYWHRARARVFPSCTFTMLIGLVILFTLDFCCFILFAISTTAVQIVNVSLCSVTMVSFTMCTCQLAQWTSKDRLEDQGVPYYLYPWNL